MNTERVIMVRESEWREMREALEPFAETAEWDIADSEADSDAFRQMGPRAAVAGIVTVGHFRKAHEARARLDAALAHPTPDGCGREGEHQWGGPERDREVCVNCGATRDPAMPEKLTRKQDDAMDRLVRLIGDEVIGVANGPEQAIYGSVRRGIEAAIKEAEGGDIE